MIRVYKILTRAEWEKALEAGVFTGSALDLKDGFIHLSTEAQAAETARLHFAGFADLVLVGFAAEDFGPALKWEPSRGGALFPHLYGQIDPGQALEVRPLPLDESGVPQLQLAKA